MCQCNMHTDQNKTENASSKTHYDLIVNARCELAEDANTVIELIKTLFSFQIRLFYYFTITCSRLLIEILI